MPEIITKYPDIVLQVLRGSGAECGTGAAQRILTACPAERFCSLPAGEICVYGLNETSKMTQISAGELAQGVSAVLPPVFGLEAIFLAVLAFAVGAVLGMLLYKRRKKK